MTKSQGTVERIQKAQEEQSPPKQSSFAKAIHDISAAEKGIAAIWYLDEQDKLVYSFHSKGFPQDKLTICSRQLEESLLLERIRSQVRSAVEPVLAGVLKDIENTLQSMREEIEALRSSRK